MPSSTSTWSTFAGGWQRRLILASAGTEWRERFDQAGRLVQKSRWDSDVAQTDFELSWFGGRELARNQTMLGQSSRFRVDRQFDDLGRPDAWTWTALDLEEGGAPTNLMEGGQLLSRGVERRLVWQPPAGSVGVVRRDGTTDVGVLRLGPPGGEPLLGDAPASTADAPPS